MAEFERKDRLDPAHGDTLRASGSVNQRFAENAVVEEILTVLTKPGLCPAFTPINPKSFLNAKPELIMFKLRGKTRPTAQQALNFSGRLSHQNIVLATNSLDNY